MNEALCSILSGEDEWCYDTEGRSIKFNKDGTGELWCRCNFSYWIAAELEWKRIELPNRVEPLDPLDPVTETESANQSNGSHILGRLALEITLSKQMPLWVRNSVLSRSTMINELGLFDDAFQPKRYTVRLEKGNFTEPCYIGTSSSYRPRFALRLVFDKSPYPPRSEWRKPEGGPDGGQFWDLREFVARRSPELDEKGTAMNDLSATGWANCTVS